MDTNTVIKIVLYFCFSPFILIWWLLKKLLGIILYPFKRIFHPFKRNSHPRKIDGSWDKRYKVNK